MAQTLHLTADEQKAFQALPEKIRKGWTITEETCSFTDTPEQIQKRMRNLRLKHPALKKLQKKAKTKKYSPEEVLDLADTIDLSGLAKSDILELAFAWGPGAFSAMIGAALTDVSTVDAVHNLAHLTFIRHGLLDAVNR